MSSISWITESGSLGVIPEGVFYLQSVQAQATPYPETVRCIATTGGSNIITCDTIGPAIPGLQVEFFGSNFGGLRENVSFFVLEVLSDTEFTITDNPNSSTPVTLTTATGNMTARFRDPVQYKLQAGFTPSGIQVTASGSVSGVPTAVSTIQGVPFEVSEDVTSKFTIRAFTLNTNGTVKNLADRTFSLTITGNDVPEWVTPSGSIGTYIDGDEVDIQLEYTSADPNDVVSVRLVSGSLPRGLQLSTSGRIAGYIRPFPDEENPVGYDLSPISVAPYDFISSAISKNYQFTLEVSDGKSQNLRTFTIFVYNRADITSDDTYITGDNTFVTADITPDRAPFLINAEPTNIGVIRGDNYFAYRFVGQDYDTADFEYAISVNEGFGLPPGLTLDTYSGWYYGYVPDVGVTETTYSFYIQVRARSLVCSATTSGTDIITCDTATRQDMYVGAEITFEGDVFGGLEPDTVYYVESIVSDTEFRISATFGGAALALEDGTGRMLAVPVDIPKSRLYPFTLTISGDVDREVTWLTDPDLGDIDNGATSLFKVEAVNRGGIPLLYRLTEGAFSELPQGLELLPSGDIAGRVTFNTFAIDLGATTFDVGTSVTTFDSTFVFNVNAYAEEPNVPLFKVSAIKVIDGGSGYSSAPTLTFNTPDGAAARQATATAFVTGGVVTNVAVTNSGAEYTEPAVVTVTGDGTGLQLQVIMQFTNFKRIISAARDFTIRVNRAYDKPYQNLYIAALPPLDDRAILDNLLNDDGIFVPEYIYRPTDPNFGIADTVIYQHAVGLDSKVLETYVEGLQLNHYWKNLTLGEIRTAQAVDATGQVIYEVVYSSVVDDLVNNQGNSVSKEVSLAYPVPDPLDISTLIDTVYPNSLTNMRDQIIDAVGRLSNQLPLWMTSKQVDGSILGFTPAWVICYTKPNRSRQIAYYINRYFGQQLNRIDFKVDRYVIDSQLTKYWDASVQDWRPQPLLTTFDRINTTGYTDIGIVNVATELSFLDVQNRTIDQINALGGLDGQTWTGPSGVTPPVGTRVIIRDGSTIVFVKQEGFEFYSNDQAFTSNTGTFDDDAGFDAGDTTFLPASYDFGSLVPGGYVSTCTQTQATDDMISCSSTLNMRSGNLVYFSGGTFGGIVSETGSGYTKKYYVYEVDSITATLTNSTNDRITVGDTSLLNLGDQIWIDGTSIGGIPVFGDGAMPIPYYVIDIPNGTQIQISDSPAGAVLPLTNDSGAMTIRLPRFSVAERLDATQPLALSDGTGSMLVDYRNDRLAIYEISVNGEEIVTLTLKTETVVNDFVTTSQGFKYSAGSQLYRPSTPELGLSRIAWTPLLTAVQVVSAETTFDQGSVDWVEPVDMYDDTDELDKYLVFPKTTILS